MYVCVVYIRRAKKMSKQSDIRKHLFDGFLKFTYNPFMCKVCACGMDGTYRTSTICLSASSLIITCI